MILLLTNPDEDYHADVVEAALSLKGAACFRLHTEDLPTALRLSLQCRGGTWDGFIEGSRGSLPLAKVRSVWNRRPRAPRVPSHLSPTMAEWALMDSRTALNGLYHFLRDAFWVSSPQHQRTANNKPYQLSVASALGFAVPDTIITNHYQQALDFFRYCDGRVIFKPIETMPPSLFPAHVATSRVREEHFADPRRFDAAPVLLQREIRKKSELRVNVIGDRVFAAEILSQEVASARLDYRMGLSDGIPHRAFTLPASVEQRCRALTRELGLQFGALDLIYTPEEEFVFLEINPAGQWLWVEEELGDPLLDSLCEMLIQARRNYGAPARPVSYKEIKELLPQPQPSALPNIPSRLQSIVERLKRADSPFSLQEALKAVVTGDLPPGSFFRDPDLVADFLEQLLTAPNGERAI